MHGRGGHQGTGAPVPQMRAWLLGGAQGIKPNFLQCWRWGPAVPHPFPSPLPQPSLHRRLSVAPSPCPHLLLTLSPSFRPHLRVSCLGGGGLALRCRRRRRLLAAAASVVVAVFSVLATLRHLVAGSGNVAVRLSPAR